MTRQLTRTSNGSGQALAEADAQRLAAVLDSALSANTRRAYRAAATRCADWLRGRGLELDGAGLAAYVADLADQGRAPAMIKLAASAVGTVARPQGLDDPRGELTRLAVKGATRQKRDRRRGQVQGLRREDLEVAARLAAADGSPAGLRDVAELRLGSDGLLRVGELAAVQVADLETDADGSGRRHRRPRLRALAPGRQRSVPGPGRGRPSGAHASGPVEGLGDGRRIRRRRTGQPRGRRRVLLRGRQVSG